MFPRAREKKLKNLMLINAESTLEKYTEKVEQFNPTHVMILDAANFKGIPGEIKLITSDQFGKQPISTHRLPLSIFISIIENVTGAKVILLGIQPESTNFMENMSSKLEETASFIANKLIQILSE